MQVNSLKRFPSEFSNCLGATPPLPKELLWQGADPFKLTNGPTVAIVGSRKASVYGRSATENLAKHLALNNVVVVSGLALGIDSVAHRQVVGLGKPTIAVLPAGLDNVYPSSHRGLAKQIVESGGSLVSEYPLGATPRKENFIARNRLISALSDIVIITDAARASGSLHTAHFALEQGKTVAAIPGNTDQPNSQGTNWLIKQGAQVITEPQDVLNLLGISVIQAEKLVSLLEGSQKLVFELIKKSPSETQELLLRSGLEMGEFFNCLTRLELDGLIKTDGQAWRVV